MGTSNEHSDNSSRDVVGILPAAGHARRLGSLPCSKEVFPLMTEDSLGGSVRGAQLACDHSLQAFEAAGVRRAFVLLRKGKWDVPATLGTGSGRGLQLAYRIMEATPGVPQTLDSAYPFVAEQRVVLAFPDILFTPRTAIADLLQHQEATGADVVLGAFPAPNDKTADRVKVDDGRVDSVAIKSGASSLSQAWVLAAWTPEVIETRS